MRLFDALFCCALDGNGIKSDADEREQEYRPQTLNRLQLIAKFSSCIRYILHLFQVVFEKVLRQPTKHLHNNRSYLSYNPAINVFPPTVPQRSLDQDHTPYHHWTGAKS